MRGLGPIWRPPLPTKEASPRLHNSHGDGPASTHSGRGPRHLEAPWGQAEGDQWPKLLLSRTSAPPWLASVIRVGRRLSMTRVCL